MGTSVIVIGGGATGTGIARDLAMRGFDTTLVERGTLADGTTGRTHGLLHSGARYAVADQSSARSCIRENHVVRRIAGHCVEETGGLYVQLAGDSDEYFRRKLEGCRECNIPVEVVSGERAREIEPYLTEETKRAIRVPDHAIDPFRLCVANAADAMSHGTWVETHAEVTDIRTERGRVTGVEITRDEQALRETGAASRTELIEADHVVNATGAWADQLCAMAGVDVHLETSKGVVVVTNVRQLDTVINRCLPKGDGDAIIPHETTVLLGCTDEPVSDPDDFPEEGWEIEYVTDIAAEMVPVLANVRTIRSFWGVRPLYDPNPKSGTDTQDITRDHFLLDHSERDGLAGLTTIVGGKLTTYRKMAEDVADHVCAVFGVEAECRTHEEPLPGSRDPNVLEEHMDQFGLRSPIRRRSVDRLGDRAPEVLDVGGPNPVVCECEGVTRAEVADAIADVGADLNAVRIRTRASMGNCQGGFCSHRMAAELAPEYDEAAVRDALKELYQERWKGQRHALWGEQLSQAMLNHMHHAATMNRDGDPATLETDPDFAAFDTGPARESRSGTGGPDGGE